MTVWIRSLSTTAGFLKDAPITFARGLSCLLGEKGTFKSTAIELIRFALGNDDERIQPLVEEGGWLAEALAGGKVRLEVVTDGGDVSILERGIDDPPPSVHRSRPILAEIYSQGDLQRLAKKGELRLSILDRTHEARKKEIDEERLAIALKLEGVGNRLRALLSEKAEVEVVAASLGQLRLDLENLRKDPRRPACHPDLERERQGSLERGSLLEQAEVLQETRDTLLRSLRDAVALGRDFSPAAEALDRQASTEARAVAAFFQRAAEIVTRLEEWCEAEAQASLDPALAALKRTFEQLDRPYQRLVAAAKEHVEWLRTEKDLVARLERAERAQARLAPLRRSEDEIRAERAHLRAQAERLEAELRALRTRCAERLERENEHILLRLEPRADVLGFKEALDRLVGGKLAKLKESVVAGLSPSELIDTVERSDVARLARYGRRTDDAAKLLEALASSTRFYAELERPLLEDELEIQFRDGEILKPIEKLSEGQRAAVLIPLVVRRDLRITLVIDQLEDNLDNRYLSSILVRLLRELKKHRQVILVTHNPNLVVLARAERVTVMRVAGAIAAPPVAGSLKQCRTELVHLLEGGPRPFRIREREYDLPPLSELGDDDDGAKDAAGQDAAQNDDDSEPPSQGGRS
jgi:predicted ATPase